MAGKSNGLETSEWARVSPPSGSVWQRIAKAIYDPDEKSFLGRTPKRWGIMVIFYAVFYAVLAILFALCMAGLYHQLDNNKPYYTLQESLIGINPGVSYRPCPADGIAVQFDVDNSTALDRYTSELEEFLEVYQDQKWFTAKKECKAADNYGLPSAPCFYIKLNKIYGWRPQYFDGASLPSDMSTDLSDFITSLPPPEREQVWVSCWSENSNETKIEYPWGRGLAGRFYPYINANGYVSPLVAVKITPPANKQVILRCRAWAKNIEYNKSIKEASGYARIQLRVDNSTEDTTE